MKLLISAKTLPPGSKPSKSSWLKEEKFRQWIKSLEAYAIDACKDNDQSKIAGNVSSVYFLCFISLVNMYYVNNYGFKSAK